MNHRQWKKKFKKEHGRNPYPHEDKRYIARVTAKELLIALDYVSTNVMPGLSTALEKLGESIGEVVAKVCEVVSECANKIADITEPQPTFVRPIEPQPIGELNLDDMTVTYYDSNKTTFNDKVAEEKKGSF